MASILSFNEDYWFRIKSENSLAFRITGTVGCRPSVRIVFQPIVHEHLRTHAW